MCVWEKRVWQFKNFSFGLTMAPQVFTWVMVPVASVLYREDIRVLHYLDDWLVLHKEDRIALVRDRVLHWYDFWDLVVNRKNSHLTPTITLTYFAMVLHLRDRVLLRYDFLDLVINRKKPHQTPTITLTYLGMILHSMKMAAVTAQTILEK